MASPMMNMLSYWFFFAASFVMFGSLFIETGPASGGWTAYPPLNGMRDIAVNKGSGLGFDLWLTSISLFIVSSLLGGLNYISTVINLKNTRNDFKSSSTSDLGIDVRSYLRSACFPSTIICRCIA